jgi:hypothetical protein
MHQIKNIDTVFDEIADKYIPQTIQELGWNEHSISSVLKDLLYPKHLAFFKIKVDYVGYDEEDEWVEWRVESRRSQKEKHMLSDMKAKFNTELPDFLDNIREDYFQLVRDIQKVFLRLAKRAREWVSLSPDWVNEDRETSYQICELISNYLWEHRRDYLPKENVDGFDFVADAMHDCILPSWEINPAIYNQFWGFDLLLPDYAEICDEIVNPKKLIQEYMRIGRIFCKEMEDNFAKRVYIQKYNEKLVKRASILDLEYMDRLSKDLVQTISEFFGREAIYQISFIQNHGNIRNTFLNYPTKYLEDFVEERTKHVPLEFISKIMNSKYDSKENAIAIISNTIVNPEKTAKFYSGKILYIKICGLEKKYKKMLSKYTKPVISSRCYDCKVEHPISQMVARHSSKDLHIIQKRCFACDSNISKMFSLTFSEKPYCFHKEGSIFINI